MIETTTELDCSLYDGPWQEQPVTDPQEAELTVDAGEFDLRHNFIIERANGEEIGVQLVARENLWWVYVEYQDGWELIQSDGTGYVDAMRSIDYLRDRIHKADDLHIIESKQTSLLESIGWAILIVFPIWLGIHLIEWLVKQ